MIDEFDRIYELYNKDLFRLIFNYTLNVADSKDILQDTFLKYYQNMSKISKDDVEIKKWLMRVAINKSKDYKKFYWHRNIVSIEENRAIFKRSDDNFEMFELLNKIDKKYRIPMFLYYYDGYKISEIASILNISESAIKMRLSRAKKILKKELEVNC